MPRATDQAFYDLLRNLKTIQQSDGLGMRVKPKDGKSTIVMFFRTPAGTDLRQEVAIVQRILRVSLIDGELDVVFGSMPQNNRKLAVLTWSMLQIIVELASHIDVPPDGVAEGRVYATQETPVPDFPDLINIHSGTTRPTDANAAVGYRDLWFWIDDRDLNSKRMFALTMLLFSLTETGGDQRAPLLTVTTN